MPFQLDYELWGQYSRIVACKVLLTAQVPAYLDNTENARRYAQVRKQIKSKLFVLYDTCTNLVVHIGNCLSFAGSLHLIILSPQALQVNQLIVMVMPRRVPLAEFKQLACQLA